MCADSLSDSKSARSLRFPKYRLHRPSGQGVATIGGKDFYFGPFRHRDSRAAYDRRIGEWVAAGRPMYSSAKVAASAQSNVFTIDKLVLAYLDHAKSYFDKKTVDGTIRPTCKRLCRLYGTEAVADFGPLALKAFRLKLVEERIPRLDGSEDRLSRRSINRAAKWVVRIFKWGVGCEIVSPLTLEALREVDGLREGRVGVDDPPPELEPVGPVPDSTINATLPHLPPVIADIVRVQRWTGMRPSEVCGMRASEIDMTGKVWLYKLRKYKTAHHGHARIVPLGPKAQDVIRRYLKPDRPLSAPLFSPKEAESDRLRQLREENVREHRNKTPITPSRAKRDAKRARNPKIGAGQQYTTQSYGQAIRRACEKNKLPHWSPNQIRHTRATEIRAGGFGLEGAGAVLGHAKLDTTQIYAEKNHALAYQIALATG